MGYHRAGFEVVGVDINPQPRYPFEFHQGDAMTWPLGGFDAIHASPPCQAYSALRTLHDNEHPDLVEPTRDRLRVSGVPWVIENVEGAPLVTAPTLDGLNGILLCGTMFGLRTLRHRLFESDTPLAAPPHPRHVGEFYTVTGHGDPNWGKRKKESSEFSGPGYTQRCRDAMGISWMSGKELVQGIPPAYTEFIGGQLMNYLTAVSNEGEGK
jgi:DNA (cytosine-5)-methyltransferase 1